VESIVSQQLSVKASDTIWKRFKKLFGKKKITPDNLLKIEDEQIRAAGISYSKIKYMKGLSTMILKNELNLSAISTLSNEEVLLELTKVKGIGPWTAEMILMFSLGREDVFSLGDIGLRNAIAKLYNIDRDDLKKVEKISETWKPYRTYAARYLWKSLDNLPKPLKTLPGKIPQKVK
jgi:DNA-3-methyladenine glycosylase II